MKKRKWILPVGIIGGFLLFCTILFFAAAGIMSAKGYGLSVGHLYFTGTRTYLVDAKEQAMVVSDKSNSGNLFEGRKNGDKVMIIHGGVDEVYPAITGGYYLLCLAKGNGSYRPADEVLSIVDLNENSFIATILEINGDSVLVEPVEGEDELRSSDQIRFHIKDLEDIGAEVGSVIHIAYTGTIMETDPAKISAISWELATDLRNLEYTEQWIDKSIVEQSDNNIFGHVVITKIYSNCFFARTVIPMPYEIKLNGELSEDWCVGDQVVCTYKNVYYDSNNQRVEVDVLSVKESDWEPEPGVAYKPVIYLYPEKETEVSVQLKLDGRLTCTYPAYSNGWKVKALPDGTLRDAKGQTYNYLYWEGETYAQYDLTKGFCVKGEDTAAFLETTLEKLGLNRREANEFIVYWLPLMEQNPYNIISFQTDIYTDATQLTVSPTPDTLVRVFMAWKETDSFVEIPKQEISTPIRTGFTVVEWGGTEIK